MVNSQEYEVPLSMSTPVSPVLARAFQETVPWVPLAKASPVLGFPVRLYVPSVVEGAPMVIVTLTRSTSVPFTFWMMVRPFAPTGRSRTVRDHLPVPSAVVANEVPLTVIAAPGVAVPETTAVFATLSTESTFATSGDCAGRMSLPLASSRLDWLPVDKPEPLCHIAHGAIAS
ncbi:hypothetical protein QP157_01355 [Sphingomonas sp. LR61]|uniref:hypothetical protein n=1 Tax=Sphingomonas sp. LR61 TaxID=3050234 RepID=UPI002FE33380